MARKNALGKGLGALIPGYGEEKVDKKEEKLIVSSNLSTDVEENVDNFVDKSGLVVNISLSKVEPRSNQPRQVFEENSLNELSESIKVHGVLQPILVCKEGDHYTLVAGERRWRAAKMAGLLEIPAIVRDYDEQKITEIALIENLQREDLNPIEEAQAYRQLIDEFNLSQEKVAERVSKKRTTITNSLRLLKLDERVQVMVMEGKISEGHARAILGLTEKKDQFEAAKTVVEKQMNVRDTEKMIKRMQQEPAPKAEEPWKEQGKLAYEEMEMKLRRSLGTKVSIKRTKENQGQLRIEYYSIEELEKLAALLEKIN